MMYLLGMVLLIVLVYPVFVVGKRADQVQNETRSSSEGKVNSSE